MVLVKSVEKWPNLFEIRRDLVEIWPNLSISGPIWYRSSGFHQIPTQFCNIQPRSRTDWSQGRFDHPNRPLLPVGGGSRNGRPGVIWLVPGWAQTRPGPTCGQAYLIYKRDNKNSLRLSVTFTRASPSCVRILYITHAIHNNKLLFRVCLDIVYLLKTENLLLKTL